MNDYVRRNYDAFCALVVVLTVLMAIIPAGIISNILGIIVGGGIVYLLYINKHLDRL